MFYKQITCTHKNAQNTLFLQKFLTPRRAEVPGKPLKQISQRRFNQKLTSNIVETRKPSQNKY